MTPGIELRHLRHFVALAEELHFGRAALRCNISQPPFSVSIKQLEDQLGFALVERRPQEVVLTPAGAVYYEEAGKVLTQMEHAAAIATRVNGGLAGILKVGFFASMLHRGLDQAMRRFAAEYPGVGLRLVELSTADQLHALQQRQIHYGFVHSGALPEALVSEELLREPFMLCLPSSHPHASLRRADLAEFAAEPFVLFSRTFSPTYYDQVVSLCVGAGFHPAIVHEARHWLTVLACVSKGMGITLVPRSLKKARLPDLHFMEIEPGSVASIVRGAWLSSQAKDATLLAWHGIVKEELSA